MALLVFGIGFLVGRVTQKPVMIWLEGEEFTNLRLHVRKDTTINVKAEKITGDGALWISDEESIESKN